MANTKELWDNMSPERRREVINEWYHDELGGYWADAETDRRYDMMLAECDKQGAKATNK